MKDPCSKDSINYLFVQVAKAHRARTHELLSRLGLHVGQEMILVALTKRGDLSLSELANMLEVQPPTVTKMVQRLESAAIVRRETCKHDSRSSSICLTSKGKQLQTKIEKIWQQVETEFFGDLSATEKAKFQTLLQKVRANVHLREKELV
jgi:MarR family transcriptional regulator, organic hydroperoxide resistance regulator